MEAMRDQRSCHGCAIRRDVRYAVRTLRRSPGFTSVAVLTLALGIGATTAIYSVVDAILLQPLPFPDSDRLVRIVENVPSGVPGRPPLQRGVTYQEFREWRARSRTLADAFAVAHGETNVRTAEGVARLWGDAVSTNTFAVLGRRAFLGRTTRGERRGEPERRRAQLRDVAAAFPRRSGAWSARASNSAPTSTRAPRSSSILPGS